MFSQSNWFVFVYCVASALFAQTLQAQSVQTGEEMMEEEMASHQDIEEIISIGVRSKGRVALDSPVPVDALSSDLLQSTGHAEVGRMLQVRAPSFNFSSSTISDGTDALRPATLRGLGPDQTLVLVNGKRRHGSALIHVNTSVGRGTAGTDLNAIPQVALKRIEVLRDGASAQYGSDAVAGVINLVLDEGSPGEIKVHYGEYSEGDGETLAISGSKGGSFGGAGFWQIAGEYRDRGKTNRTGLTGECQYLTCTSGDPSETSDPREIAFNRQSFRIGDSDSEQFNGMLNLSVPISDSIDFYLFATFSDRENLGGGFYRRANQQDRNPSHDVNDTPLNSINSVVNGVLSDGYLPLIRSTVEDSSLDLGITGTAAGWEWDVSFGTGSNSFQFDVIDSLNASFVRNPPADFTRVGDQGITNFPREAHSGELGLGLITVEFDIYREFGWGTTAFGASYREDSYEIKAGEELSYRDYDTVSVAEAAADPTLIVGADIGTGVNAVGGIQVFPGFKPENEVDESRDSTALYADVEWNPVDSLLIGGALRYEDYSDFGDTLNAKVTAFIDLNEAISLRASASTGFRAPSLQQQFFNTTSTIFDVNGVGSQTGTFRNDSAVAAALGIPALEEEKSTNISLGIVLQPTADFSVTIDYYRIEVEDRIILSGAIRDTTSAAVAALLVPAGVGRAQFFLNAADTETQGVDIVAQYTVPVPQGVLQLSLGANFTSTDVVSVRAPASLSAIDEVQNLLFTERDRSIVESWQPEERISFSADYTVGSWNISGGVHMYGEYTVRGSSTQTFGAKSLVDLNVTYNFTDNLSLTVGGNNILDEYPDENDGTTARSGRIVDGDGNVVVDSRGVFRYPRESAPFGFNGAYWFAGLRLAF